MTLFDNDGGVNMNMSSHDLVHSFHFFGHNYTSISRMNFELIASLISY